MRAGKIDRRTAPSKAFERIVAVLAADWGGLDAMPGAARLLADRLGVLTVRLLLREQRQMSEAAKGIDDPTSDKHSIALFNGFRRGLQALEEMRVRAEASPHRPPALGDYLEQHGSDADTQLEPDEEPADTPEAAPDARAAQDGSGDAETPIAAEADHA